MAWGTPSTRTTGTLITAVIWNQDVVDNPIFLAGMKSGGTAVSALSAASELTATETEVYKINAGSDLTTTSASLVDIDATNLSDTITTTGGDVEVLFNFEWSNSVGSNTVVFSLLVDGAATYTKSYTAGGAGHRTEGGILAHITGLSAASHTFKAQWSTNSGTATFYRNGVNGQWRVREVFVK
jgi:hypothetical protein